MVARLVTDDVAALVVTALTDVVARDDVLLMLVVVAETAPDVVPVIADGRRCSMTSTYVGLPVPLWLEEPAAALVVADDDSDELLLVPLVDPKVVALPSSTNTTVAPLLSIPMKFPTRGVVAAEALDPPDVPVVLAVLVWALAASGPVVGELKLPVHPCVPSVSL